MRPATSFTKSRAWPKNFRHRRPNGNDGWIWKGSERRVLYRWPELLKFPDGTVFICEGEKDADRVASLNHCASTVASGEWTQDCIKALVGRNCLILEDNDETGRKKALDAATKLYGVATTIRIVRLPDLPDGGDVSDWLDSDERRADKLVEICFNVPLWQPNDKAGASNDKPASDAKPGERLFLSSAEFIQGFETPDPLIEGIIIKFIYALTGHVSKGKTAGATFVRRSHWPRQNARQSRSRARPRALLRRRKLRRHSNALDRDGVTDGL
jgi:hypothetical protein